MQELSSEQLCWVSGGMSDKAKISVEGGVVGAAEGAILGGMAAVSLYSAFMLAFGVTSSAQVLGIGIITVGVAVGSLFGLVLGSCTGYVVACTSPNMAI